MQTQQNKLPPEQCSVYETHPLIVRMQDFLDYATHMAAYSSLACNFLGLNEDILEATKTVLEYATDMKEMYHRSLLQESVEDLLQREESILDEIDSYAYSLELCEFSLDKYLIFADNTPEIISDFLNEDGLPLFGAANC